LISLKLRDSFAKRLRVDRFRGIDSGQLGSDPLDLDPMVVGAGRLSVAALGRRRRGLRQRSSPDLLEIEHPGVVLAAVWPGSESG
jgi:hypothetical protein